MTGTRKNSQNHDDSVEYLILQQHSSLLLRLSVNRIFNRAVFLVAAGYVALVSRISLFQMLLITIVSMLLAFFGTMEHRTVREQLKHIETALTRRSGEEWEDVYIKSRYRLPSSLIFQRFFEMESFIWTYCIMIFMYLKYRYTY